jgi:protein O-mannosyl-transferase
MAKHSEKKTANKAQNAPSVPLEQPFDIRLPAYLTNSLAHCVFLFSLACLVYLNTLFHGFVLDDGIVITDNMFTVKGLEGIPGILSNDTFFGFFKVEGKEALVSGGRYRPMTLVLFAFVYELAGPNPFVFHLLTVILYGLTCVLLYQTLRLLLKQQPGDAATFIAFLATAIFAVHPIHTEVVANIKGCDEIVTLMGSLGALYLTVRAVDSGKTHYGILAALIFFLACLSKENAATFVAIVPLALYFFRNQSLGEAIKNSLPLILAFILFFIVRGTILHWRFGGAPMELMNNPFLKIEGNQWVAYSFGEKMATNFYTLWKYIQLLFVPYPLTHDYYPRMIPQMTFSNPIALLGLALNAGLAWYAIAGMKQRDPLRFGILFYLLSLSIVSNFVFPIGTNMGERFAFMPSVGFCLVLVLLILRFAKQPNLVLGLCGGILLCFSALTVARNPVWKSNESLFLGDAKNSPNSAKMQNACGGVLFDKAAQEKDPIKKKEYFQEAIPHLNKAIEIYPNYSDALISRGGAHYSLQNYDQAVADYRRATQIAPDKTQWREFYAVALREAGKMYGEKRNDIVTCMRYLDESWQINPKDPETARIKGVANGVQGKHEEAIRWFSKAVEIAPTEATYLYDLGNAYSAAGDRSKGEELRQKALSMNPKLLEARGSR